MMSWQSLRLAWLPRPAQVCDHPLRGVAMFLGAMQTIANSEEGPTAVKHSFAEEMLARVPATVMEGELE